MKYAGAVKKTEDKLHWHKLLQSTCVRGANSDQKGTCNYIYSVFVYFF